MKKRMICMLLLLCMTLINILPQFMATVSAAEKYYNDEDVTWIGKEKEYTKTLKSMFDNGLRMVPVGDLQADGSLKNIKYGLVDKYGKWAAEPIYDEIKAYYIPATQTRAFEEPLTETIFVDGYVQAVKNGKMGLLDTTGKEVIPCQYDAVGLPVEGFSRIIKKSGNKYYLGYWSLQKGKEIVKPNKYPVSDYDATAEGTPANYEPLSRSGEWEYADEASDYYKSIGSNRVAVQYDFNGGYALVPTGKVEYVDISKGQSNPDPGKTSAYLIYAQVIDTNGKEILSGGPYPYRYNGIYPQAGPYMIYHQLKKEKLTLQYGGGISFNQYLVAGVVGKKGIIIKAQYHGGIRGNSARGWFPADANMQIIPEHNLFITAKDVSNGKKSDGARTGVININNKSVIPFNSPYEFGPKYDSKNKIIIADNIYKINGSKITKSDKAIYDEMTAQLITGNGYFHIYDKSGNHAGVVSIKTGKVYTHKNLTTSYSTAWWESFSTVSTDDTMWMTKADKQGNRKWGLVNLQGKVILPFEYDYAVTDAWSRQKNGYALVKKDGKYGIVDTKGKVLIPCKYWNIGETGDYFILADDSSGSALYGMFNRKTGKMTVPCSYYSIGVMIEGTFVAKLGPSLYSLMNVNEEVITPSYLNFNLAGRGLFYNTNGDYVGPDGNIVFPRIASVGMYNGKRVYYGDDLTIVVKDGKVGYINASRLASKSKGLPTKPLFKTDPAPLYNELKYRLINYPDKQVYKIGEKFEIKGFILHSEDIDGTRKLLDHSKIHFLVSNTIKVTDGYKFTSKGIKEMVCYYDGVNTGESFQVMVLDPAETGTLLDNGTYTISVYGKYLKIVKDYIELWDTKPADKFTVKLVNYDKDRGPMYYIMTEDGRYLAQGSSRDGDQLIVKSTPHAWRINHYSISKFTTIRDYGKQVLLVNASGQKSSNGTKIIVWSHTGSAPDNGKLTFTPVN
jgi:hypothetical protein